MKGTESGRQLFNSLRSSTSLKRKRDLNSSSWIGMAFQLPAVIKREMSDFVKTVRGGFQEAMASQLVQSDDHRPATLPARTSKGRNTRCRFTPLNSEQPLKKPRLDSPPPPSPVPSILSRSTSPCLADSQLASAHAMSSRNPCSVTDDQVAGPESSSSHVTSEPLEFGSNSVHFPGSHPVPMDGVEQDLTMAPSAVSRPMSMDIIRIDSQEKHGKYLNRHSSDLDCLTHDHVPRALMDQSVSNSDRSPFSCVDHNLFSRRQFSTQTSLTSTNSTVMTHTSQCPNVASPRPRHTKLLGAPRSLNRPYTLSASSLSTLNSLPQVDSAARPYHQIISSGSSLGTSDPSLQFVRTNTTSLNNANHPHVSWNVPEDECEQLTNELTSGIHNKLHFDSPHAQHRLTTVNSQQQIRQKVPLDEVIGKPSLPNLRQPPSLTSFSSPVMSPNHSVARSHATSRDLAPNIAPHCSQPNNTLTTDRPLSRTDSTADSTATTNTSSRNPLSNIATERFALDSRRRASNQHLSQEMDYASPTHHTETSHQNHQTIEEVDEDMSREISYEFMEPPDLDTIPQPFQEKKRKRGLIHNYRELRKGFSTGEQTVSKSFNMSPSHPKPNQKIKVMTKLGLIKSGRNYSGVANAIEQDTTDEDTLTAAIEEEEEDPSMTPNKKIKFLENEVQRLRRELASQKLWNSQNLQHSAVKRNPSLLSRSKKSISQTSQGRSDHLHFEQQKSQRAQSDSTRVRFSPKSAWSSSSPASAPRFRKFKTAGRDRQASKEALTGTPVLIKKPSAGVLIGGSPFVVSRVFGEGPEVIGEKTPEAAPRRNNAVKLNKGITAGPSVIKLPGLAQDLFGANASSASARNKIGTPFQASSSGPTGINSRWTGKGKQMDHQCQTAYEQPLLPASSAASSSGWIRDSQLEKDLFGESDSPDRAQHFRRHSLVPFMGKSSSRPDFSSTVSLNSTLKPKHSYRNSIGGISSFATSSGGQHQDGRPATGGDMASFLNELKSSGRDKLRKTVGSLKYYNPQNHFGSSRASVLKPDQMPLPRTMDAKNAEIMKSVLEQDFGKYAQSTSKRSSVDHLASSSSQQADLSTTTLDQSGATAAEAGCLEPSKSSLSCRIYPSSTSLAETADSDVASSSATTLRETRKSGDLETITGLSLLTSPVTEPIGLEFGHERAEQSQHSILPPTATDWPRAIPGPTPTLSPCAPLTPQRTSGETVATRSVNPGESKLRSSSKQSSVAPRLSRSSQISTGRPLSMVDPNRPMTRAMAGPVSILSGSAKRSDSAGSLKSASTTSNGTRRVRIAEDASTVMRRLSPSSSVHLRQESSETSMDENLVAVEEEQEEFIVGGVGIGKSLPGTVVGFGIGPGKAISTSGSEWVVVKSDGGRLGDGEENLRRWSLKASAVFKAHPKIVYPENGGEKS